jgi:7-cyano-7-deazaguanine synthase
MSLDFLMLSGGLDSTALAFKLIRGDGLSLRAIYVDHGQRAARKELEAAHIVASLLGISLKIIDATGLWPSFRDVAEPTHVHIMTSSARPFGSPGIAIAAAYAGLAGAKKLYLGLVKDDLDGRPWMPEMVRHYQDAGRCSKASLTGFPPGDEDYSDFTIELPVAKVKKSTLIAEAAKLGAPLGQSWSCQISNTVQCRTCWVCKARRSAFKSSRLKDDTPYQN